MGGPFFASEEGKKEIRRVMRERYGVEFPAQIEDYWEKASATIRAHFGVGHHLQLEEIRKKQQETNIQRYGTPFPGLSTKGPNLFESRVFSLAPAQTLIYKGNGAWWRYLPKLGRHKNPDFLVSGSDANVGIKVVEAFGSFWHSRLFTGKAPFDHEQELIEAYADVGIQCLVLWESEVKSNPEDVRSRLLLFCTPENKQALSAEE